MKALALFPLLLLLALPVGAKPPNIVLILADDLGYGDVKCYGGDRCRIETPNIDALAANGLRFTNAHVNASVCVPTRIALMTGRYSWRFTRPEFTGPWGFMGPKPGVEKFTLAKLLNRANYRTGYVGKWHLGTRMATVEGADQQDSETVDFSKPLLYGPPQFGFKESFILPGSLDMFPYVYARDNVWQGDVTAQKGWSAFNRIGPAEKDFEDHEVLETFYRQAESFIGKQSAKKPFFLYLALTAPHTPTSPGVAWQGKSELGVYGDFVMEVDHSVERVMDALKENGFAENTLVLFSSDHGAASYAGNILEATPGQMKLLEKAGHYPGGPHRGYKFTVYEGGLRVPLVAHWPKVIKKGRSTNALVSLSDMMATFADLSGEKLSKTVAPDSISYASILRNPQARSARKSLTMQSAMECFTLIEGNWKLALCPGSGAKDLHLIEPLSGEAWKAALEQFGKSPTRDDLTRPPFVQLYNLAYDPHEDHNLAADNPARVAQMVELLREKIDRGRSTPGPDLENDRNVLLHQRTPDALRGVIR
ncbi:MAG: arylsulfatase [Verrucomicrobiota bacterium]